MKNSDCLPCPCCGGYAAIHHGRQYKMMLQDWHSADEALYQPCSVDCTVCGLKITKASCNADFGGADGAFKEAARLAVAAWNTRASTTTKPAEERGPEVGDLVAWCYCEDWHIGILDEQRQRAFPTHGVEPIVVLRRAEVEARVNADSTRARLEQEG